MADKSPLLKISSNLEIPQSNRKNLPTENESSSMTESLDEKQTEFSRENANTAETTTGERSIFFKFLFKLNH